MMVRSASHPVEHIGLGQPPKATKSQGSAGSGEELCRPIDLFDDCFH
jgi:hypothetical protein